MNIFLGQYISVKIVFFLGRMEHIIPDSSHLSLSLYVYIVVLTKENHHILAKNEKKGHHMISAMVQKNVDQMCPKDSE